MVKEEPLPDVITKPTLLLMGEADPALPIDLAYRSAGESGTEMKRPRVLPADVVLGEGREERRAWLGYILILMIISPPLITE